MQWYYAENDQPVGPISEEDFQKLVESGKITAPTLVWHAGMANWAAHGSISGGQPPRAIAVPSPLKPDTPDQGTCCECGKQFRLDDMLPYAGKTICGNCKQAFFQRLQEGARQLGRTPNGVLMARARQSLQGAWWFAFGSVLVVNVLKVIASSAPYCIGFIISLILGGAFEVGLASFVLNMARKGKPGTDLSMIFDGFLRFGEALVVYLLYYLLMFVAYIPTMMFVGGGVLALVFELFTLGGILMGLAVICLALPLFVSYTVSMIFFILADEKSIGPGEVFKKSYKMMRGRKFKLFRLHLRFLGWCLLALVPALLGLAAFATSIVTTAEAHADDPWGVLAAMAILIPFGIVSLLLFVFVQVYAECSIANFYDDVKSRGQELPP
ncbi:MAG: hypothetical protein C0404_10015 [Verrucomicrobia bacterium]|nr:hypothetical protein [Verrucomicrobiota bacterium]